jgi:hypothetical protein
VITSAVIEQNSVVVRGIFNGKQKRLYSCTGFLIVKGWTTNTFTAIDLDGRHISTYQTQKGPSGWGSVTFKEISSSNI